MLANRPFTVHIVFGKIIQRSSYRIEVAFQKEVHVPDNKPIIELCKEL